MSRYILKTMYLEKPKRFIIWNWGNISVINNNKHTHKWQGIKQESRNGAYTLLEVLSMAAASSLLSCSWPWSPAGPGTARRHWRVGHWRRCSRGRGAAGTLLAKHLPVAHRCRSAGCAASTACSAPLNALYARTTARMAWTSLMQLGLRAGVVAPHQGGQHLLLPRLHCCAVFF